MRILTVESFTGIPPEIQEHLYVAMVGCGLEERLLVCLLMMSDLPDKDHHLGEIERNLRLIYPPTAGGMSTPDEYANFQASAIRGHFNH